jgi:hypothetical protein
MTPCRAAINCDRPVSAVSGSRLLPVRAAFASFMSSCSSPLTALCDLVSIARYKRNDLLACRCQRRAAAGTATCAGLDERLAEHVIELAYETPGARIAHLEHEPGLPD